MRLDLLEYVSCPGTFQTLWMNKQRIATYELKIPNDMESGKLLIVNGVLGSRWHIVCPNPSSYIAFGNLTENIQPQVKIGKNSIYDRGSPLKRAETIAISVASNTFPS